MKRLTYSKNNSIALGTAQFGFSYGVSNLKGQVSFKEASAILGYAKLSGIGTLDTAIGYGSSEARLGEIGAQDWSVVSKLPALPAGCQDIEQWVEDSVQASLKRLNHTELYGLLLHRPRDLLEIQGDRLYTGLLRLKKNRLVKKIGVSIYETSELDAMCDRYDLDLVQAPFNLLDNRIIHSGWMKRLEQQGTELHVRSIFLQGLLLMSPSERPRKFERWKSLWEKYDSWLLDAGLSPLQACIRFALSFPGVSKAIVGVESLSQLREIIEASDGAAPTIPSDIKSNDVELLNPASWEGL